MTQAANCLIEIGTEELPPLALEKLAHAFAQQCEQQLQQAAFEFKQVHAYATPRRLALMVEALAATQPDQDIERKGPAVTAAFDDKGKPTPACEGFAKSCGCAVEKLQRVATDKGEWLVHRFRQSGKPIAELLPDIVNRALKKLPIPKRMRWGDQTVEFARPVHWVVLLYGDQTISGTVLGMPSDHYSYGHRFHHPDAIKLKHADDYVKALLKGKVMVDAQQRRQQIQQQVQQLASESQAQAVIDETLLQEVTALVEWPVALLGEFEESFLQVPAEALIMAMKSHQRYFHLVDQQGGLLPKFIAISNIESRNKQQVIIGNQRVLKARLADAQFFYQQDLKHSLDSFLDQEKSVVFQAKLGNLYEKSTRIAALATTIAESMGCDVELTQRAGMLCKTDLMSDMVGEFPELQGVMGAYYATHHHEPEDIAKAIEQHYLPRFSGDELPATAIGQAVAIADRLDTIVGILGINQKPSGVKDPFGLRRAAVGVLRIIIEKQLNADLHQLITFAAKQYVSLPNDDVVAEAFNFIMERLRAWYLDQGISAEVFMAVMASQPTQPLDFDRRIHAVASFQQLPEAQSLAAANKRVSRLLTKQANGFQLDAINEQLFESEAEKKLAQLLRKKQQEVLPLYQRAQYQQALQSLAELKNPVDQFFDEVMVMVEDENLRNNRLALLASLQQLFLQIADISQLP